MRLENRVNRVSSSSSSNQLGNIYRASSASAHPLEPFNVGNSNSGSYGGINLAQASADGSTTPNLAYRVNQHIYVPENPQEDLEKAVKEDAGGSQGIFNRISGGARKRIATVLGSLYLAIASMAYAAQNPSLTYAQFADGNGVKTTFRFTNSTNKPAPVTIELTDGNGQPLPVSMKNTLNSTHTDIIPAYGALELSTDGSGSIKVGSARVYTIPQVSGVETFDIGNTTVSVGASTAYTAQNVFAKSTPSLETGLAIVNASPDSSIDAKIILTDKNGNVINTNPFTISLSPNGHYARMASEIAPTIANRLDAGAFNITTANGTAGLYVLGLLLNKVNGNLSTLPSSQGAYVAPVPPDPNKDVNVNLKVADVVSLTPMNGVVSTINIGSAQYQTSTGTLSVKLKPGNYTINANNASIFPEWKILRYSANCDGTNAAQMDLDKTTMTLNVPDTAGSLDACVIGIPNKFVDQKSLQGNTITKNDFTWVIAHNGTGDILYKFADPRNVWERYTKSVPDDDTVTKQRRLLVFNYIAQESGNETEIIPHEGGGLPSSNTLETLLDNEGPSHGETINRGGTIISARVSIRADQGRPLSWGTLFEEYFQALYALADPFVNNKTQDFTRYFWTAEPETGPTRRSDFGDAVFFTTLRFTKGTKFR